VALWRALHVEVDPPPHVLDDVIGLVSGTPFLSFFTPDEMLSLARDVGFAEVRHISGSDLGQRYFAGRTDQRPSKAEEMLVART
jgi:hypothetical protein